MYYFFFNRHNYRSSLWGGLGISGCPLLFTILLAMLSLHAFAADNSQVRKIRFEGNKEFKSSELKDKISFSASTWVGQKVFGKKVTYYSEKSYEMNVAELIHFYRSEGFLDVQIGKPVIKTRGRKQKVEITFVITENQPVLIDSVDVIFMKHDEVIEGFYSDIAEKHKDVITARKGVRFRDELVWNDKENIQQNLINRGYPYAHATPRISVNTARKTAAIVWETQRGTLGYFGDVMVEGQKRTPERIIRKQVALKRGDVYSREKLNVSQQQIYQLGTFRIATVKAQIAREQTDTIPLRITLNEAPRTATRVGIGYGREDQIRGFIDFTILNFPGGARRLTIYAKHSALEPYRVEATLMQPAVFGPNSTLSLSPFVKRQKESSYGLLNYGVNVVLAQKFTKYMSGSLNPYYEQIDLDASSISDLRFELSPQPENYSKSGIAAGFVFNSATPQFEPTSGWTMSLNTKLNSLAFSGEYPFYKYIAEIKNYQHLTYAITVSSKFKIGSVTAVKGNDFIPVEERFYAGGSHSVRGWSRHQLTPASHPLLFGTPPAGGNSLVEISVEPRIKIYGPLSLVVFSDIGNVWLRSNYFRFNELRFSAGAGLRFSTPIGPIGIDFARPVFDKDTKWQFHLNIGNSF
ncbi:MAG: BamA/TamA family outer membrane protein [Cytophagaceae bacterium]|jgi:outer membrane protein insertion porin family|nr:BamA/TamA family outer membrane protein [Cytophagaceae bacterium]